MDAARASLQQLCSQHHVRLDHKKVSQAVADARALNRASAKPGEVRCGRVWRGQRAELMPYREDSIPIFASKGKGQIGNALSPFHLDVPAEMLRWATEDGSEAGSPLPLPQKLELVWQSAKKAEGESWEDFFARRARIYRGRTPKRRYIERGAAIAGACFGSAADALVQYIPSRVFYCFAYEKAVESQPEFLLLRALVDDGFNLLILGPDGHPVELEPDALTAAYFDESLQFGHERVLLAMLRRQKPWADQPRCW